MTPVASADGSDAGPHAPDPQPVVDNSHWRLARRLRNRAHAPHLSASDRRAAMDALMLRPTPESLRRFAALMGLSVVVAVMGLLQDSTAVVVGAMVIAPLMAPIMGIAASLVMGWAQRLVNGVAVVILSVFGAIALAWAIALFLPSASTSLPQEVLARSSPDVRDLLVALAAGTAGAYATVRRDMSGALPGVAVAVALVPPLATVGILLGRGQPDLAAGAGLLFVTNLFAILLAAAMVFLATGFVPPHRLQMRRHRTLGVLTAVLVPTLAIGTVLTIRFASTAGQAHDLRLATQVVLDWLQPGEELNRVSLSGSTLQVNVSGEEAPSDLEPLTDTLRTTLGRQITVDLRWTPTLDGSTAAEPTTLPIALDEARPIVEEWLTAQSLTLDGLSVESGALLVRASGPQPPHDSTDLTTALADSLGVDVPVSLSWTLASASTSPVPDSSAAATIARTVVNDWVEQHSDTTVLSVTQTDGGVVVTLTAETQPDIEDLRLALTTALPQATITVRWLPSNTLSQDIPVPTPTESVSPNVSPSPS